MRSGRPKTPLTLSDEQREQLQGLARSRSLPSGLVDRVRIVLMAAEGESNKAISTRLGLSEPTVGKWRKRFLQRGVEGLHDELRPGRPRSISDEQVAELVNTTLQDKPAGATHWSCRTMAKKHGVSKATVNRIWQSHQIKPHRTESFHSHPRRRKVWRIPPGLLRNITVDLKTRFRVFP